MKTPRVILFTGKGGTGKTTIAAATAVRAAELGHKTLVMSADPAHSLGDAFDRPLTPEPLQLLPNLFGQEIDLYYSMRKHWDTLQKLMVQMLRYQGVDAVLAEELAAPPGMAEAAVLFWVEDFFRKRAFDLIIVDSAATAESMTLLSLPQVGKWWMERVFPFQRAAARWFAPVMRMTTGMPVDEGYRQLEALYDKLLSAHAILTDPDASSVRLVVNPERMVIREVRRTYAYLQLYGYPVDGLIVNRILPEDAGAVYGEYLATQRRYLQEIDADFSPLPVFRVNHLGREVFGIPLLQSIGRGLYEGKDPTGVFFADKPFRLTAVDGAYLLEVKLPFVAEGEVDAAQHGDELVLQLRNQRRNLFLPAFLAYYRITDRRHNGDWLQVRFEKPVAAPA